MPRKKLKNRIAIVLDRSTSMDTIRKEAVSMFNDQLKSIKRASRRMDTTVSLFTFSTVADEPIFFNKVLKDVKPLKLEDYVPNGWTAMYDSIGKAIDHLSALPEMSDPNCSFLVIVITDGEENRSARYNGSQIADRIQLLQRGGKWTFTFSGANLDLEKMQQTLHIPKGNMFAYASNAGGMSVMSASNSRGTEKFLRSRSMGVMETSSFYSPDPVLTPNDQSHVTTPATTPHTSTTSGTPPQKPRQKLTSG